MHLKRSLLILLVLAAAATAAQAEENQDVAKDQDVAKECEAKTLKAHLNKLPNTEATDKLRQEFYTTCINRAGKMNPMKSESTVTVPGFPNNVHESTNRSRETVTKRPDALRCNPRKKSIRSRTNCISSN